MRKLLLALLVVALFVAPAAASVQNVKVSGEVDSKYLYRNGFDAGAEADGNTVQSLFITITNLRVDADLTDNVAATIALINERTGGIQGLTNGEGGAEGDDESDVQINLAYVTLREMLYSPLTVIIGRQSFRYGNSFIVDSAGPNNAAQVDSVSIMLLKTYQSKLQWMRSD